jgi:amylosucrase
MNDAEMKQLGALLTRLYGPENDVTQGFLEVVELHRKARSPELQARDVTLQDDWFRRHERAAYVLYVDRFCADASAGKKLRGLAERLDYFRELGIDQLHLLPLLESAGDGGFAVRDFGKVAEEIGPTGDLITLIRLCHDAGIYVVLDLVLNHVADTHPWARDHRDYFIWSTDGEPWPGVPDIFPEFAAGHWDYVREREYAWSTFYARRPAGHPEQSNGFSQWDLNYQNPKVLLAMLDALLTQANWGVDMFRLDAVPFLWKQPGTSCMGLPECHDIVKLLRLGLNQVAPRAALLAEASQRMDKLIDFFGNGNDEVHTAYRFDVMTALWRAMAGMGVGGIQEAVVSAAEVAASRGLKPHWWVFSECHDEVSLELPPADIVERMFHYYRESGGLPFRLRAGDTFGRGISGTTYTLLRGSVPKILLLWKLQITLGGTPLFYMGAELGVPNDPNYRDEQGDTRFVKRPNLGREWTDRATDPERIEYYLYHQLARWLHWRRDHACLAGTPTFFETGSPSILGYIQDNGAERLLFVANCSDQPASLKLPDQNRVEVKPWRFWCSAPDTPEG